MLHWACFSNERAKQLLAYGKKSTMFGSLMLIVTKGIITWYTRSRSLVGMLLATNIFVQVLFLEALYFRTMILYSMFTAVDQLPTLRFRIGARSQLQLHLQTRVKLDGPITTCSTYLHRTPLNVTLTASRSIETL